MESIPSYTHAQLQALSDAYRTLFPTVRIITPAELSVLSDEACPPPPHTCFFCADGIRCRNCVSLAAYRAGTVQTKLEFQNGIVWQVMALPVNVEGQVHVIEVLRKSDGNFVDSFVGREELRKTLAESTHKLYTDVLTGAYSRRYYEEFLRDLRTKGTGVAIMDVDDFKLYNDFFGHNLGDTVLRTLVGVISDNLRAEDRLVRYGGDEFLLILPQIDETALSAFLGRLRKKIGVADVFGTSGKRLSVSIGGVISGDESISDALERADRLLMLAKQRKNHVMTTRDVQNAQTQTEKPTVLICDDSPLNREILSVMLGGEFHILEAEDGESCIRVLQSEGTRVSLCLLDIIMPNKDGFDVLAYMNETHLIEEIPVIIITGDDSAASIRRAYHLGVTDYINRPFDSKVVRRRALNTVKLYAKQRRLANMLADRLLEKEENAKVIIDIFSHAVEFRNAERGSHVLNISRLTRILLEQLVGLTDRYALTPEDIEVISTASMLHDIGKIGIDEKILNKPDKLTAEETAVMRRHTLIGAKILEDMREYRDLPLVKTAIEICRSHHERWDGSGYPDGLRGDEIPISAQVAALADCYDALVSKRIYKNAYTHEEAIAMLLSGKCGAFNSLLYQCLQKAESRF